MLLNVISKYKLKKKKCKLAKKAKHLSSAVFEMESSQGMFQKSVCFLGGRSNLSKEKILFLFFFSCFVKTTIITWLQISVTIDLVTRPLI